MNLGQFLQAKGRVAKALDHYRQAIKLNPRLAETYNSYAYARCVPPVDDFSHDLAHSLEFECFSDAERAHLHYAAGKAAGDQGRDGDACAHWLEGAPTTQGNQLRHRYEPEKLRRQSGGFRRRDLRAPFAQACRRADTDLHYRHAAVQHHPDRAGPLQPSARRGIGRVAPYYRSRAGCFRLVGRGGRFSRRAGGARRRRFGPGYGALYGASAAARRRTLRRRQDAEQISTISV